MQKFEVFEEHFWNPLARFGLTSSFWGLSPKTIIFTWVVLLFILILCLACRYFLRKENGIPAYMILSSIRSFKNLTSQTLGIFSFKYFAFLSSLFIFILMCNIISFIPFLEEPTADPSTTIALGLIAFFYVQVTSIRVNGIKGYIKEYFSPFFLLFPLNVVGELAKIVSMSFRLFGNIFGGSIITKLWTSAIGGSFITELIGILTGINFIIVLFFVLFEGFIQSFVFCMLTMTYLSIAISGEHAESETNTEPTESEKK